MNVTGGSDKFSFGMQKELQNLCAEVFIGPVGLTAGLGELD